MTDIKPGDTVDVVIKGVQFAYDHNNEHNPGRSSILADDGRRYTMPPQAAITPADQASIDEHVSNALKALDGMEMEGYIEPYVAATVRKKLGLPPRHWPPQPGDVWTSENPFCPLWFAQLIHDDGRTDIVMAPLDGGPRGIEARTPDELLDSPCQLALGYRNKNGDNT